MKSLLKGLFLFIFLSSFASFGQAGTSVSNPIIVNSFPHTETNVNSANGAFASGMQGSCYTIPCCSVLVYKAVLPSNGLLRVEMTNFTPLAGSIIAYRSTVANPTSFSDLEFISAQTGNFCGFRDSLQLGRGYTDDWDLIPYGGSPTQPSGLTSIYDFNNPSVSAGFMPAGDYYIIFFNENQQSNQGIGNTTNLTFEFAEGCAPLTTPTSITFDTLEVTSQSDTSSFYVKNDRQQEVIIDTSNLIIGGTHASDFSILTWPDTSLAVGDSTLIEVLFTASSGGQKNATLEIPFADTVCSSSSSISLSGTGAEADINLIGNSSTITNNDLTPSVSNFTDMGSIVTHTGSIIKEYFITNTGADTLEFTGSVTLTGNAQFAVINQPASTVLPGDTTSFKIEFTPTSDGLAFTDVSIVNNDASQTPFTFRVQATGTERNGLHFDGSNDYVTINDVATSMNGVTTWSIESWIKADPSQTGLDHILAVNTTGSGNPMLFRLNNGILSFYDGSNSYTGGSDLRDDTWHHVAATYNNGVVKMYVDGFLVSQATVSTISFASNYRWSIGQEYDGNSKSDYFKGTLNEIRIWNTVKTDQEIADHKYCEISSPETVTDLVAYYTFNQGVSNGNNTAITSLIDASSNAYHGVLTNFANTGTTSNFVPATNVGVNCNAVSVTICDNNTYSVGGNTYTTTGLHIDTLTNSNGQDSIVYLDLSINYSFYAQSQISDTVLCPTDVLTGDTLKTSLVSTLHFVKSNSDWVELDGIADSLINTNRSVFLWMRAAGQVSGTQQVLVGINTSGTGTVTNFGIATNEQLWINDGGTNRNSGITVTDGNWHHVGYTYDEASNLTTFYVDGVAGNSFSNGQSISATSRISLGQEYDGSSTSNFFDGDMTEVSIWNEVLDLSDIAKIMHNAISNTHPKYGNLISYHTGNALCSDYAHELKDMSGNGLHGVTSANSIINKDSLVTITGFNASGHFNASLIHNGATLSSANPYSFTFTTPGSYVASISRDFFTISDTFNIAYANGCSGVIASITTDSNVSCNGGANGGATASTPTGAVPMTYLWSNAATTASITGVTAGTYSVTITDFVGDTNSASVTITEPAALASVDTVTNCGPYTWSNGVTYSSSTSASQTFTSATGCDSIVSLILTVNPLPVITQQPIDVTTPLASPASFTTQASGNVTYQWFNKLDTTVTRTTADGLLNNAVLGVIEYNNSIWVGTTTFTSQGGGLVKSDDNGVTFSNNAAWDPILASRDVRGMAENQGNLYVIGRLGAYKSVDGGATFNSINLPNIYPQDILFTPNNNLYIPTKTSGINISTDGGTTYTTKTMTDGLPSNNIYNIDFNNDTAYLATASGLSITKNGFSTFLNKTTADGLVSNTCMDVVVYNNTIYVATSAGLSISTDGGSTFTTKTTNDGLPSNICYSLYEKDGLIYVGTYSGVGVSIDNGNSFSTLYAGAAVREIYISNSRTYLGTTAGLQIITNSFAPMSNETLATVNFSSVTYADTNSYFAQITNTMSGCVINTDTVQLNIGIAGITASIAIDSNVSCNGFADGGATASNTGGTAPYIYSWSNAATTASITGVAPGTYSVTITDANTDTSSASVTITQPAAITGTEIVTACGSYTWNGITYTSSNSTATDTLIAVGGCDSIITLNLTINPLPTITQQPTDLVTAIGNNDSLSVVTSGANLSYQWFGFSNGLTTFTTSNGLRSNNTKPPLDFGGKLWVPTTSGISFSTDNGQNFTQNPSWYIGLRLGSVSFVKEIAGEILIGAGTNLFRSTDNGTTFTYRGYSDGILGTISDVTIKSGKTYIPTTNGFAYSTNGTSYTNYSTTDGLINNNCTGVDFYNDTILISTAGGLSISKDGLTSFINKTTADGLGGNYCLDVIQVNGVIYVATTKGVSISTDGGNTFVNKNTANGLPNNYVKSLYENNGNIYAATLSGAAVSTDGGNSFSLLYNTASGLPSNSVSGFYKSNSQLYIATQAGLVTESNGFAPILNDTASVLKFSPVSASDSSTYYVQVSNSVTHCEINSNTVSVTISNGPVASIATHSDVTCNGLSDGAATASVSGGTAPFTYAWSNSATTASITGIAAGTYSVTITDANTDTSSASITITQPAALVASVSLISHPKCKGDNNGQALVSVTGGTAPYSYLWPSGYTGSLYTSASAGTYTVTSTDANGCSDSSSVTFIDHPEFFGSVVIDSNTTNGASNGGATAIASGGVPPYTYQWTTGDLTASISGVPANSYYYVGIGDSALCGIVIRVIITNSNGVSASTTIDSNVTCNGLANGGATAIGTGGPTPYSYLWSNGATTDAITGLVAGNYTVTITDNSSNTSTSTVTITQPAILTAATVVDSNVTCNGFVNGGATASATGGTAPYTYVWSNSATTASITGVTAGNYSVTVTDANGCSSTSSATVTEPTILVSASVVDSNATCNGAANGGATASATGGTAPYTYVWSNSATTASITGIVAGTYSVTITDANGCSSTSAATVTEPVLLVASSVIDSNITCNGSADGGATASATGGTAPYTYAWTNSATTASITGVVAGTYSVTITDANGCTSISSATVTEPAVLTAASVVDLNATCNGATDGGASASATGGTAPYTYAWNTSATTASITGVGAGTYSVTITDANGCSSISSTTVTEPVLLVAASVVDSNITCNGSADGGASASATGGTAPYTYVWSNSATTASITGVTAGNYSVTVTDANGCSSTSSATVTEPTILVSASVVDSNATCNGAANGGATASATGGTAPYTYVWSNSATTASITGIVAGTYSVTITDANGCSSTSAATVTEPVLLVASSVIDSNITCNGSADGGATASATGGTAPYTYAWNTSATTASITGVGAGTYSVTITDANGCTSISSATVTEPAVLTAASVVDLNATCNGATDGGASASATGGTAPYTYAWNTSATTASITGVGAGTYSVTITDANGCSSISSTTVTEPVLLVAASVVDSNITCNGSADGGASASATGGTAPYTYVWSNSATTASITGVIAGTYSVTVTDANGCYSTSAATVTEPVLLIAASIVDSNATCNGAADGGTSASATGGTAPYTYVWSNSATTASITGIVAGTYSVTITDANGCSSTSQVTVVEPAVLQATSIVDSNITCNGLANGGATASATGGTSPYSYSWNNSATTASITGVGAGTYSVTITDANGCSSASMVTMVEPAILVAASIVDSNATCNGFANGGATASATGGTAPYTFAWDNSATTSSITGVVAGTYTVTITDANGCTSTSSATITEPTLLVATSVVDSNTTCNGFANGGASASATGGTAPYTYLWNNSATTASITGVVAGTYSVTIMDANGCTAISSTAITEPVSLVALTVVDSSVSCNGISDGGATASATGGTTPYSYAWNNAATTASITGLTAGTYSVSVSDANGCSNVATVTISEPNILLGNSDVDSNATCDGLPNGGASAIPTGGTSPYAYLWSTSATTSSITGLSAGSYAVTVTDANGCTSIESVIISSNNSTYSFISENACNSYTSPSGLYTWTATGSYQDTIPNQAGCDSIITIMLTINENGSQQNITICKGESITVGSNTYTTTGSYSDTFTNVTGCDSTVITDLIVQSVDVSITQTGYKLEANNTIASYQWINCDSNNAIIIGAINRTYLVTVSGNYAVIVTEGGCVDTSNCILVDGLGIADLASNKEINVYPNPVGLYTGMVTIDVSNISNYAIIIRDLTGKMIYINEGLTNETNQIDVSRFAAGTFFIEIRTDNFSEFKRLIVM